MANNTRLCKNCQEEFTVGRNSRRKVLCDSCGTTRKFSPFTKTCKSCNNEFNINTYIESPKQFCSHSCSARFNNTKRTKYISCIVCQKEYKSKNSKSIYCSIECNLAHKKEQRLKDFQDGKCSSVVSKKILLEIHGNVCLDPLCAWDFSKRNVNVELEHIDGNSHNNNPDNLTLLCPSCHSLTPTYKARNKGNGRAKRLQRYHEGKSW